MPCWCCRVMDKLRNLAQRGAGKAKQGEVQPHFPVLPPSQQSPASSWSPTHRGQLWCILAPQKLLAPSTSTLPFTQTESLGQRLPHSLQAVCHCRL